MERKAKGECLVWIDMEMTGLDPEKEGILEVATLLTDKDLNILKEGPNLVIRQPESLLKKMDAWNQNQHAKSGLLAKVRRSKITVRQAEAKTLDFIRKHCAPKRAHLCGNAVYHDRRFMAKYMPKLHGYLHYRLVDVSTIKVLAQAWYPKDKGAPKKKENHRALDDIRESVEELRYLRRKYFKAAGKRPK